MKAAVATNAWWLRRLLMLPVHLAAFAVIVFFLVRMIPGDPVYIITAGQNLTSAEYAAMREALGLNGTILEQFWVYAGRLLTLNFGTSLINGGDIWNQLSSRIPQTVELAVIGMAGVTVASLAMSYVAVFHPRNVVSRGIRAFSRAAGALPDFILGVLGIFLFYAVLRWVPAPLGLYDPLLSPPPPVTGLALVDGIIAGDAAFLGSVAGHLALPFAVLVVSYTPIPLKILLRSLDEEIEAPATRFRIAAGASRSVVVASIYRRALPATIAVYGILFGFMLGGVVIIEQLFGMPGMGQYAVESVNSSDLSALQAFLLVVAAMSLAVFLLVDITIMALDPRRRSGSGKGARA
jgi:peptide/nickel transport system permease protein